MPDMGYTVNDRAEVWSENVLDLYEDATLDIPEISLAERDGNWVQKFRSTEDGSLFVGAQFFRYQEVEQFIKENFEGGSPLPKKRGEA